MDVTLLRTLTLKSTLKFGKYSDLTVQNILDAKGIPGMIWLTWAYYSASKISFNQEILDILCITPDIQITKPGTVDKEEFFRLSNVAATARVKKESELSENDLKKLRGLRLRTNTAEKKRNTMNATSIDKKSSVGVLQRTNHGHNYPKK